MPSGCTAGCAAWPGDRDRSLATPVPAKTDPEPFAAIVGVLLTVLRTGRRGTVDTTDGRFGTCAWDRNPTGDHRWVHRLATVFEFTENTGGFLRKDRKQ